MIILLDGSALPSPIGLPPAEQMIFGAMQTSPASFSFANSDSLAFELRLRANILHSAQALSTSGARFSTFAESTSNPMYWNRTPKGAFELRPGVAPADAIRDIFQQGALYSFECATAMVIVLYRAIIETMGDAIFNEKFANLTLYDWNYDRDLNLQRVAPERVLPGDIVYFTNPDVSPLTPWWIGENAVDMGGGYYFGHGVGIVPGEEIIVALNRNRVPGSMISASLSDNVIAPNYPVLLSWIRPNMANPGALPYRSSHLLRDSLISIHVGSATEYRFLPIA
ncbi:protein-glutamine gamma-glutamyltransferase [Gorillibacterium sp. CAU 1737]|uniref:protein-glutamine gamma-glutamyltransferase n=1 Tax=Gorillibacterium sp. CAU 1737 TaxID=3140362 RepID=UPI0032600BDC